MPFTPFHMGPGILVKSLLHGSFSLMVFGWAQIVMDMQPLWVMISGHGDLHGISHTYIGSAVLTPVSAITGKYLAEYALKRMNHSRQNSALAISWKVAWISAAIGCFSHVFLDSIMHTDVVPFYPLNTQNPFWHWLSLDNLHRFCVYSGIIGTVIFLFVSYRHRQKS